MKLLTWLDQHLEEYLLIVLMGIMLTAISLQVFMRYVMENSLMWSEEVARYTFIWLVYIAISYGVKQQRHISVDALQLVLKQRGKHVLAIIANGFFLLFALLMLVYGTKNAVALLTYGQSTPATQIPMGLVYLAAPVGMGLTAIRLIQQLIYLFQHPDKVETSLEASINEGEEARQ